MEQLLPYYQRELGWFREYCREFGARFPAIAGELQMSGDVCEDPHAERMIQGFALLAARVSKRLDDDYPQFTESLLETLYPHYLRTFPSCSIAQLSLDVAGGKDASALLAVPRGTLMHTAQVAGVRCRFSTASAMTIAPVRLASVRFDPIINAPASVRLARDACAGIDITIETDEAEGWQRLGLGQLRVFIDGEPSFCAAVRDALFMRACGAYVDVADGGPWTALETPPIRAAGFDQDDALVPVAARSHPAYRLLTEYFAMPEKFNFFDIAFDQITPLLPARCRRFTLHLALRLRADASLARTLGGLSAHKLLLNCVPVVNLFRKAGSPVKISHSAPDYPLLADGPHPEAYEIHTVESALLMNTGKKDRTAHQLQPFYSRHHGQGAAKDARYWVVRRDEMVAELSPGHELRIALVDHELTPIAIDIQTLSVEFTCSNRDLPSALAYGQPDGDMSVDGLNRAASARFLRKPSAACRFDAGNGAHWRLISHLSLNHRSLSSVGVEEFRQMLTLYDLPRSPITQRQIQGVVGLEYKVVMAWVEGTPCAALMPGIEVRMTLDEEAFVGGGIHLFAQVVDHFFGLYSQINVFSQLLVLSKRSGEELLRCPPRSGEALLA